MLNFVICEDKKEIRDIIKSNIHMVMGSRMEYFIYEYDSFDEQLKNLIDNCNSRTIFILDLHLRDGNTGYEIALKVKEQKKRYHKIIFLTGKTNSAYVVFKHKINPIDFISKNEYFETNLVKAIKEGLKILLNNKFKDTIMVKSQNTEHLLFLNNIMYFCKVKETRYIEITTTSYTINAIGSLNNILDELNDNFIKINKSVIVNAKHIKNVDIIHRGITMVNGMVFDVSKKLIKEIIEYGNTNL